MQWSSCPHAGRYLPGKDTPVYGDNLGPHCYPVPFPGIHLNDGTTHRLQRRLAGYGDRTGQRACPEPARRLDSAELTALWAGRAPGSVPAWGSSADRSAVPRAGRDLAGEPGMQRKGIAAR